MTVTRPRLQSAARKDAHRLQVGAQKVKPAALWQWLMPRVWKKLLSCPLTGGCIGVNVLGGYTTSLHLLTFHNAQDETTTYASIRYTKMLQNTKACLLSPSSSSTRYDQMSASSSTGTEKVGPEVQEVSVWKIRWVSISFKPSQTQGNFPVKLLAAPATRFFFPL